MLSVAAIHDHGQSGLSCPACAYPLGETSTATGKLVSFLTLIAIGAVVMTVVEKKLDRDDKRRAAGVSGLRGASKRYY